MSTFQGFTIGGIDSNQYPFITVDKNVIESQFYLILKPIDGDSNSKDQILWNHCFRKVIKNWQNYDDLKYSQQEEQIEVPPLEFIFNDNGNPYLCVSEIAFAPLRTCVSFIEKVIKKTNLIYLRFVRSRDSIRKEIDQFNQWWNENRNIR